MIINSADQPFFVTNIKCDETFEYMQMIEYLTGMAEKESSPQNLIQLSKMVQS